MRYDPLSNGKTFTATVTSTVRSGSRQATIVVLGLGEIVEAHGVSYQAVPYAIDSSARDRGRNRHPLVEPDAPHRPVPLGTTVISDTLTGECRLAEATDLFDAMDEKPAGWSSQQRIAYADSLVADPGRRVEAFGQYVSVAELGGDAAAIAHLRLAEWQARDDFALATQSTSELAPPDVALSVAAHLAAASRGDTPIRRRSGEVALAILATDALRCAGIGAVDAVAASARSRGDVVWAALLQATAAQAIAGKERARAVRWIAPAVACDDPSVRAAGVEAAARIVDAARLTQDEPIVNAVVAVLDASRLSADERRPVTERIAAARNELQPRQLDALIFNIEGRIGDLYDLRLNDDVASLVDAGGRWRDAVARFAINHAVDSCRAAAASRRSTEPIADEAYCKLLDTAVAAADRAGERVAGDTYGVAFATGLGTAGAARAYAYIHRGLGSTNPELRTRALALALPLAARPAESRPFHMRNLDELRALETPEADELLAALGSPAVDAPLVGHGVRDSEWQAASGHAARGNAPLAADATDDERPTFGLLSRFRQQPPTA